MYGYHGRILIVDLTRQRTQVDELSEDTLRTFIGGGGLGTYLLYRYAPPNVEPLSAENPLIFAGSPFIGTSVTTSSKYCIITKSPLTGFIGDSLSSSFMATALKQTGYDAIILTGMSAIPVYVLIDDGTVRFLPADHLLGLSAEQTATRIREEQGDTRGTIRVAAIGIAGENGVRYATISNDGRHAGRTGTGAVMGAKLVKALAVRGTQRVPVAQPAELKEVAMQLRARSLGAATAKYRQLGTVANVSVFDRLGALPTRNFVQGRFEAADQVSGERLHTEHRTGNVNCAACTIGCEQLFKPKEGGKSGRLEYETLFATGPLCGIGDADIVIRAARLCDELGMDTISTGVTVAWAMECVERGLLGSSDAGDLRFGSGESLLAILPKIALRDGLGDLLAEGTRHASQILGGGSEAWAMHVKGLEMPGYEPRSLKTMALGLAVSTRGACHNRSAAYEADFSERVDRLSVDVARGRIAAESEDQAAVLDSLILCKFVRRCFDDLYSEAARIYELITGWSLDADGLRLAGERINNLKKAFNIREGWTRADDSLPPRILNEPLVAEASAADGARLTAADLNLMIGGYYRARGWTPDGMIPLDTLRRLGLDGIVSSELKGQG